MASLIKDALLGIKSQDVPPSGWDPDATYATTFEGRRTEYDPPTEADYTGSNAIDIVTGALTIDPTTGARTIDPSIARMLRWDRLVSVLMAGGINSFRFRSGMETLLHSELSCDC